MPCASKGVLLCACVRARFVFNSSEEFVKVQRCPGRRRVLWRICKQKKKKYSSVFALHALCGKGIFTVCVHTIAIAQKRMRKCIDCLADWQDMFGDLPQHDGFSMTQEDSLHGLRIHCWVLVRAGKREMSEDMFVEASTGKVFQTDSSPYLGIEGVFNHKNYWVDMQVSFQSQDSMLC